MRKSAFRISLWTSLIFLLMSSPAWAGEAKSPEPEATSSEKASEGSPEQAIKETLLGVLSTKTVREQNRYLALVNYAPVDLIVPSKLGLTAGMIETVDHTLEFEYLRGKFGVSAIVAELGSITDQRISLIRRSYLGFNSFHWSYGVSYFDIDARLGDEVLSSVSGQNTEIDILQAKAIGTHLSVGNRWTFENKMTIGIDWITWSQPVAILSQKADFLNYVTNTEDRDNVEKALRIISYTPRFSLLKFQIGLVF